MKVCSTCRRCYATEVFACIDDGHPPLSEIRTGSCEAIAGYCLNVLLDVGVRGEIYAAHHMASGRTCLIRILRADETNSHLFLRETELAAALFHPGIADIYEAGTLPDGEVFVVTEDIDGQTLGEHLKTAGLPELLTSIHVIRQAAEAVHAIHLKGLTHRAVNPENIILTTDAEGRLLVRIKDIDFGGLIERSIISDKFSLDSAIDLLRYFSPEQCSGGSVSIKTDVYSLGIVLHEMLAGAPPFDASKATTLIEKHRNERPPEIRIDDFELRMLVSHTLAESLTKQPGKRQSSANAFARQLRHIEQLSTHVSTPPPAGLASPQPARVTLSAAAATTGFANIEPHAMIETRTAIVMGQNQPAPTNVLKSLTDDQPEIPALVSVEPAIEDFSPAVETDANEKIVYVRPGRSRLKLLRRKLHPKISDELNEGKIFPVVKAVEEKPATSAVAKPTKIEWEQPENDIPSEADALEVLAIERSASVPSIFAEPEAAPSFSAPVKIEWEQPEVDIPSEAEVIKLLSDEGSLDVQVAQTEPEVITALSETPIKAAPDREEPEEITLVSSPRRLIRIEWEGPARPQTFVPVQRQSGLQAEEITFFPTILGNRRETSAIDCAPEDAILSDYYDVERPGYSVPYRSIMIGGGILGLIALFLFGNLVTRFGSTGGSGDTVAAKTSSATETQPPAAPVNAVSTATKNPPKYFDKPRTDDTDTDTNGAKSPLNNDRTSLTGQKRQTSSGKNTGKTPATPSTIVIFTENGKTMSRIEPEKRSTDKKPISVTDRSVGATRPRIVKEP